MLEGHFHNTKVNFYIAVKRIPLEEAGKKTDPIPVVTNTRLSLYCNEIGNYLLCYGTLPH